MNDVLTRLANGEAVAFDDPGYHHVSVACTRTRELLVKLNAEPDAKNINAILEKIIQKPVDETVGNFRLFM